MQCLHNSNVGIQSFRAAGAWYEDNFPISGFAKQTRGLVTRYGKRATYTGKCFTLNPTIDPSRSGMSTQASSGTPGSLQVTLFHISVYRRAFSGRCWGVHLGPSTYQVRATWLIYGPSLYVLSFHRLIKSFILDCGHPKSKAMEHMTTARDSLSKIHSWLNQTHFSNWLPQGPKCQSNPRWDKYHVSRSRLKD